MASQNGVEYVYDTRPDAVDEYYDSKLYKEWKFNASQAQLEREWQEKMWDLQNRYNHPANQKARLTAAGLNPYGEGTIGSVPAGSAGSPNPARATVNEGQNINAAVGNLVSAVKVFDETRRTDAEIGYKNAAEANLYRQAALLDVQRAYGLMSNEKFMFELKKMFEAYGERNPFTIDADNKEADTAQKRSATALNNQLTDASKALTSAQTKEINQRIEESKALVVKMDAESKKILADARISESNASRQEFVDAASAFYGFQLHDLPSTLQVRLVDNWQSVVKGDIYAETAYRVADEAIEDYREKELHISRTRSYSDSENRSTTIGDISISRGASTSWLESY